MSPQEQELALGELEERVDRLRVLYDQYFLGFEKLEPTVPRKEIDRRFAILRKESIRNTALRFRFNVVTQKYNTYSMYWTRICRQIEEGTFKRHVQKAKKILDQGLEGDRNHDVAIEVAVAELDDFDMDALVAEAEAAVAVREREVPPPRGERPAAVLPTPGTSFVVTQRQREVLDEPPPSSKPLSVPLGPMAARAAPVGASIPAGPKRLIRRKDGTIGPAPSASVPASQPSLPASAPRVQPAAAPRVQPASAPRVQPASAPQVPATSAPRVPPASAPQVPATSAPRVPPASAPQIPPASTPKIALPAMPGSAPRIRPIGAPRIAAKEPPASAASASAQSSSKLPAAPSSAPRVALPAMPQRPSTAPAAGGSASGTLPNRVPVAAPVGAVAGAQDSVVGRALPPATRTSSGRAPLPAPSSPRAAPPSDSGDDGASRKSPPTEG